MGNVNQTFKWSLVGVMIVGTVAAGSGTDLHGQDEVSPEIELRNDLLDILDEEQLHSALAGFMFNMLKRERSCFPIKAIRAWHQRLDKSYL